MDGCPTGAEDCAGSGLVGSEVRIGVQGATTSLVMTRVKHHSQSWVGVVARGNRVRRRRQDVVIGAGVGSASGDWGQRRLGGWSWRSGLYGCDSREHRADLSSMSIVDLVVGGKHARWACGGWRQKGSEWTGWEQTWK